MAGLLDFFSFPQSGRGLLGSGPVYTQGGEPLPMEQQPNFWRGLANSSDALMGLGLGLMSGAQDPRNGMRNALIGFQAGANSDRQQMVLDRAQADQDLKRAAAAEFAKSNPQYAALFKANPALAEKFAEKQFENQLDPTQRQLRQAQIDYYRARSDKTADETLGLNPIYAQDKDGNTIALQVGNRGTVKPLQLPEGSKLASGIEKIDAGTYWVLRDKRTGQTIGTEPKNVADVESQKEQGQSAGAAIAAAPGAIATGERTLSYINELRKHPGKSLGTGYTSLGNRIPSTPGYDFQSRVDQLKGGAFLEAFASLRGGGAITEIEGQKATAAINRMNTATSEKEFDAALTDFENVVRAGVERAKQRLTGRAGGTSAPTSGAPDPLGIRGR